MSTAGASEQRDQRSTLTEVLGGTSAANTWTILFTDLVGSTVLRTRVGEDAFDGIRTRHDELTETAIAAHGGKVVKGTGDGVMAVFSSATNALTSAALLQRQFADHNRQADEPLGIRTGLSIGDAVVADNDIHGVAVVEARRLCDAAEPGEILCSALVVHAAGSRGSHRFGPVHLRQLKGLPEAVAVRSLEWHEQVVARRPSHRTTFRVLGALRATRQGIALDLGGRKERAVLAALLAADRRPVAVDVLVEAVWGEQPPRSATRTVQAYIARLRRSIGGELGEASIITHGRAYALDRQGPDVDADRFTAAAARGRASLERGDPGAALTAFDDALAEWHGSPYEGYEDIETCATAARWLDEQRQVVVEDRFDALLAVGRPSELIPLIEAAAEDNPLRERRWGQLMVALYRAGRQADALRTYQRVRRLLIDELGIEPGSALRELEAAVLAQDDRRLLGGSEADAPSIVLPVRLDPGGSLIVGRADELARFDQLWATTQVGEGAFVSVVGPEGVGKTRLVAQFASGAHRGGAVVAFAQCDEDHRAGRTLFDQALRSAGSSLLRAQSDLQPAEHLGSAIARHLVRWSQAHPVLVVLDDLHQAEADVLELVADVAASCRGAAVLIVALFRTQPDEPAPAGRGHVFALEGLDRRAAAEICALYGDSWATDEIAHIHARTGGMPLALHEQASAYVRRAAAGRADEAAQSARTAEVRLAASQQAVSDEVMGVRRVADQRWRQQATRTALVMQVCPFRGLMSFDQAHARWFFGRDRVVADVIAHLVTRQTLAVVGASGSGKSSLVRAGVVPALLDGVVPGRNIRRVVVFTPGATAVRALRDALSASNDAPPGLPGETADTLIVVDQLEELFTLCPDPDERAAFADALREEVTGGAVLLAVIRADQFAAVADVPELARLLAGNDVLIGAVRDSELREAIVRPCERAGLRLEEGLVDQILSDSRGSLGVLPLVQTALLETWVRRSGDLLTLAGYHDSGGVRGAIARLGEDMYASLDTVQREWVRRILLRLAATPDDGVLDLRRRVAMGEVVEQGDADARLAFDVMVQQRLVTVSDETVEITHEALLREWPRLRDWLEEDVEGRRTHQRLSDSARAWDAGGRDPSDLARGSRLTAFEAWALAHDSELNQIERAVLEASRADQRRELDAAVERADREARSSRRLRRLLTGVVAILVVALAAGAVAVWQRNRADQATQDARRAGAAAEQAALEAEGSERDAVAAADEARRSESAALDAEAVARSAEDLAQQAEVVADAGRLAAQSVVDQRIDRALLSSVAALGLDENVATRSGLFQAIGRAPYAQRITRLPNAARPQAVAVSPDGSLVVVADNTVTGWVLDAATGSALASFDGEVGWGLAFFPDGRLAYGLSDERGTAVVVADPLQPEVELGRYGGLDGFQPHSISVDVAGQRLSAVSHLGNRTQVAVWDASQPATPIWKQVAADEAGPVVLTPDGAAVAIAEPTRTSLVEVGTGRELHVLDGHREVAVSPDGSRLATILDRGPAADTKRFTGVAIYDPVTGQRSATLDADRSVTALDFTSDGAYLLIGTAQGTEVWDPSGRRVARLTGQAETTRSVAGGPDGAAYSVSLDGTLVRWAATGRGETIRRLDAPNSALPAGWLTDRTFLSARGDTAYLSFDQILIRDATGSLDATGPIPAVVPPNSFTWAHDGQHFFTGSGDAVVRRWARGGNAPTATWTSPGLRSVLSTGVSPDGGTLAVGLLDDPVPGQDGGARDVVLLDAVTLEDTGRGFSVEDAGNSVGLVEFDPSGGRLLVGIGNTLLTTMFDLTTGGELWRSPGEAAAASFSADGERVVTGGYDGTLILRDAATGSVVAGPVAAHDGFAHTVQFSPDGAQVMSTGTDGLVRLWSVESLEADGTFDPGDGTAPGGAAAAFTPDETHLMMVNFEDIWEVPYRVADLTAHICQVAGRDLTADEWTELLPDRPQEPVCPA